MWYHFIVTANLCWVYHPNLHFTTEAEWGPVLCQKGYSYQVAILFCLFSCLHPALPSSALILVPALISSPSSPPSTVQNGLLAAPGLKLSWIAALTNPPLWQQLPEDHSPPPPASSSWGRHSAAPPGLGQNLICSRSPQLSPDMSFPCYVKIWKNSFICCGLFWELSKVSTPIMWHTYTWQTRFIMCLVSF